MNASPRLRLRTSLMVGCAACGLALTLPGAARGQAFDATPSTVAGSVTYNRATPGVETVTVNSDTAIILWGTNSSLPSNPYIFLPAGNTATFQNGVNNQNFVVLNRIQAFVPVQFDGRVVSQLVSASGTTPGGTVLFSTPGGIILGPTAVFDVGNLVLTTLDVNADAAGNFYDPATRGFTFSSGRFQSGAVTVQPGARINAPGANSYVALVAPSISQGGNVQVNGAAAYIAGNQVEMRANDGLFDIIIAAGTDSATPITHTGTTGGPASTDAADIHRIYMVAVPRNQAITTLLQGSVGFNTAVSASVENGAIVLSSGYNVVAGDADATAPVTPGQAANLTIQGGTISSRLIGTAVTNALANGGGGQLNATQDLTLVGGQSAILSAGAGETVAMGRNVSLLSPGADASITASGGGSVSIAGNALLDATGIGFSPPTSGDAGTGQGGQARIYANGGSIAISGDATLRALGYGGSAAVGDYIGAGGNGYGGYAIVQGTNDGTVRISGNLDANASGYGGWTSGLGSVVGTYVDGATGEGGDVLVVGAQGGSVVVTGSSNLRSNGTGGASYFTAGGRGQGDDVRIEASGGNVTLTGPVSVSATGTGGTGASGGDAQGGELAIDAFRGSVVISGATSANLNAVGGNTLATGSGPGGAATGGSIDIFAESDSGAIDIFSVDGQANGTGGTSPSGSGGAGTGGQVSIITFTDLTVNGSRPGIRIGALSATVNGNGAAAGSSSLPTIPGVGTGGSITIIASQAPVRIDGATSLIANGTGGAAPAGAVGGATGQGGSISIGADRSFVDLGTASLLQMNGQGGAGPAGGAGQGGQLLVEAVAGNVDLGDLATIAASGTGGSAATGGAGGTGAGGTVQIYARSAAAASNVTGGQIGISVSGTGGVGGAAGSGPAGAGGNGSGGTVALIAESTSGNIQLGALSAGANGNGGAGGSSGGQGGTGSGGNVQVAALGGAGPSSVSAGAVALRATGQGGAGGVAGATTAGGRGGNGNGGSVSVLADAVAGTVNFGATTADAGGAGGNAGLSGTLALSGRGGDGTGGSVTAGAEQNFAPTCGTPAACAAAANGSATFASLALSANGAGGQGGTGGNGNGGRATLQSVGVPTIVTGAATLRADAAAGAGVIGFGEGGGTIPGGTAGQAFGGLLVMAASPHSGTGTTGRLQAGSIDGTANATGGIAGSTPGRWQVSASGGSSISATDLNLAAQGGTVLPAASRVDVLNGGTLNVTGTGTMSSAGSIQVNASAAGKVGGGTIRLIAGDDVVISHANPPANAVTIDVGDLTITAADDVTVGAGAVTRSTNGTNVQAGDLATFGGRVLGRNIQVASADIALTGGIGDAGTQSVTLNVAGATPPTQAAVLGGTTQGLGYTLTQAEAALIRADALRVNAPAVGTSATRNPDLIVRDLSFNGGGAATGIGTLTIVTPGIARVQGNLLMAGARPTDGIAFTAAQRLEVLTPNGSIRVRDASGAPGGTLALSSNDIWAVNQAILDKLHTDPAYATRDTELANNGGSQAPRGYIEGNAVTLTTSNSLYVQNTGANPTNQFSLVGPAFGGITVGPGGLTIRSAGSSPASVTAFGSRINADGTLTIGYDFFFEVNFQVGAGSAGFAQSGRANLVGPARADAGSPTGYTANSTFNTCVIPTGQCALRRPPDTGPGGPDPIVGPPGTIQLPPGIDDDNVDTSFATEPLIEEPVTSGGESTLWAPPCDPTQDRRCVGEHP